MKRLFFSLCAVGLSCAAFGAGPEVNIVPKPLSVTPGAGTFTVTASTVIGVGKNAELRRSARIFAGEVAPVVGGVMKTAAEGDVRLAVDGSLEAEAYTLAVTPSGVEVRGGTPQGVFHGLQSLRQLVIGIRRETVGDLLVSQHSCDILLLPEILPYLRENFTQAGRVKLKCSEIPLPELSVPPIAKKLLHGTVSSLRLDAVAATGFGTSRAKMTEAISSGRVSLNHLECTRADQAVAEGDVLACRGMGKCRLIAVGGLSRKGRVAITVERYL